MKRKETEYDDDDDGGGGRRDEGMRSGVCRWENTLTDKEARQILDSVKIEEKTQKT